jgi:hypothetical protein
MERLRCGLLSRLKVFKSLPSRLAKLALIGSEDESRMRQGSHQTQISPKGTAFWAPVAEGRFPGIFNIRQ